MYQFFYLLLLLFVLAMFIYCQEGDVKFFLFNKKKIPDHLEIREILNSRFHFFKLLKPTEKRKFVSRLVKFLKHKDFHGKEGLEITDEIRVLIAASAVQLTFGFAPIILKYFHTIYIYPSKYRSLNTGYQHVGEVSSRGIIRLSWKDFLKTLEKPNNALNLGLHEMSHALKLENAIKNGEYGFMSTLLLGRLHKISLIQMRKIRRGEETFIRKYAASNHEEFFAVSIEYFFERPIDLKKTIPTLYEILRQLLRQDPAKRIQAAGLINS